LAILEAVEAGVAAGEVQDPWHQVEQQQHLEGRQVLVDLQQVQGEELQQLTTSYQHSFIKLCIYMTYPEKCLVIYKLEGEHLRKT
jgi:hypothetical protein